MEQLNLPKKILRVNELTFELPEDFNGDLPKALKLLSEYVEDHFVNIKIDESDKVMPSILEVEGENKLSLQFGIFELNQDGYYYKQ